MSTFEMKDGSGSLFRNEKKNPEQENQPDYNGSLKLGGIEYWLNGWQKVSAAGKKYMSLSIKPKELQVKKPAAPAVASDPDIDF